MLYLIKLTGYATGDESAYNFAVMTYRVFLRGFFLFCRYIWCPDASDLGFFYCSLDMVGGWVLKRERAKCVNCSKL